MRDHPETGSCSLKVQINIDQSLKEQFMDCFRLDRDLKMDPAIGVGGAMKHLPFPGGMEFYHFPATRLVQPVAMRSINPPDSEWFLVHINLSAAAQRKFVAGEAIELQKTLPIGMLIYGPGLEIDTPIPPNVEMELASIRFNSQFLSTYVDDPPSVLADGTPLISEDLDYLAENRLQRALDTMGDKLSCHSAVLALLDVILRKLRQREGTAIQENLRQTEIDGLFRAAGFLRDLSSTDVPTLDELASLAGMGRTKFSNLFKQVFGSAPMNYRNRVRMEFAREQIVSVGKSPTEVSYLLGYSHPSNFTAAYKKHFGELPSSGRR